MKRKTAVCTSIILAIFLIAALFGCGLFFGADSVFPYDGALKSGYTGTEAEYMAAQDSASTRERQLYEEALSDGSFTGSYLEFLQELGTSAPDDTEAVNGAFTSVVCITANFTGVFTSTVVSGSGVIYSLEKEAGNALIITNYHVLYKSGISTNISVFLYGETESGNAIKATYLGGSVKNDLAVLKVTDSSVLKESSATAAVIGDSDSVTVGERVYALGNANGKGFSATGGVVSVAAEYINITRADEAGIVTLLELRTDAAVNHGNSGGGLFNARGELLGIVNARSEESGVVGFGYAIPVSFAVPFVQNIIDNNGRATVALPGFVSAVNDSKGIYDEQTGKYYIQEQVIVETIDSYGAAFLAGLRRNDTILSATLSTASGSSKTVQCTRKHILDNLLVEVRQGDALTLNISRGEELRSITINFNNSKYFSIVV